MATVTGLTAARMAEIEAASIVDGQVVGNNLILTRHDETTIDAGNVRGPAGTGGESGAPGTTVHSELSNLSANDHPQYLLAANHTKAAHDSLLIDAATLDGIDSTGFSLTGHNHDAVYLNVSGDTMTGTLSLPLGTVTEPSITFTGDTNTGLYSVTADELGFSVGGTQRARLTTGFLVMAVPVATALGAAGTPSYTFSGDSNTGIYSPTADELGLATGGALRLRATNSYLIPAVPIAALGGSASAPGYTFDNDPNTGIYSPSADQIGITTGGVLRAIATSSSFDSFVPLRVADSSTTGSPKLSLYQTTSERAYLQYDGATSTTVLDSDSHLGFNVNNARAMTIDSSGRVAVGVVTGSDIKFRVYSTDAIAGAQIVNISGALTGSATTQYGLVVDPTATVSSTALYGIFGRVQTSAAAITLGTAAAFYAPAIIKGAGSAITLAYGLYIAPQTAGDTNYSIYVQGGESFFGGNIRFGTTGKLDFHDETGDKLLLYGTTYGVGIEDATLTNWSGVQFRWRVGGTNVSTGTERMLLTNTSMVLTGVNLKGTITDPIDATGVGDRGFNDARYGLIQSNFIINGYGELGDKTKWSGFTSFGTNDGPGVPYYIEMASASTTAYYDDLVPIAEGHRYKFSYWIKLQSNGGSSNPIRHYGMAAFYDADLNLISPHNVLRSTGATDTTLAAPLNPGDTTITVVNATGWHNSTTAHARNIGFWPYTNAKGYTYPDYTYTRLTGSSGGNIWAAGGITGNVITLTGTAASLGLMTGAPGGVWPIGTPVRNVQSGGTYNYFAGSNVTTTSTWTRYEGTIGPLSDGTSGGSGNNNFRAGAAFIKFGWLLNRDSNAGNPTTRISAVDVVLHDWIDRNGPIWTNDVVDGVNAAGYGAGISSSYALAIGYQAAQNLPASMTGTTAIGGLALSGLITPGTYNVAVGTSAGLNATNQAQSTLIGSLAGYQSSLTSQSSLTAVGYQAGRGATGLYNTAVGHNALMSSIGASQTAVGYQAGYLSIAPNTVLIGQQSGSNLPASATGTHAIGMLAFYNVGVNTDTYNVAVGYQAGYGSNYLSSSVLVGTNAGYQSTPAAAANLTGVGYGAVRQNTGRYVTAVGHYAGYLNTGNYFVGLGHQSGQSNSGNYSTGIGYQALYANTGVNATAIGHGAGTNNTFTSVIAIGVNTLPTSNNQLIIGSTSYAANTWVPGHDTDTYLDWGTANTLKIFTGGSERFRITTTENLSYTQLNMQAQNITNVANPTTGDHVGDRDYNDIRYVQVVNYPNDGVAPAQVTGVVATAGFESLFVEWTANTEADMINGWGNYHIQVDNNADFSSLLYDKKVGSAFAAFSGLPANTLLYIRVRAIDAHGNPSASWSTTASGTPMQVVAGDLADNSVTTGSLQANAITAGKLAANSVTAAAILAGTITATEIATGTITATQIAANAITSNHILANTIQAGDITANTITANEIAANAITANELAAFTMEAGKYIRSTSWVSQTSGFHLGADGAAEFNGTLFVKATTTLKGDLTVGSGGAGTIASDNWSSLTAGWKISQGGAAEFNSTLHVAGTATVKGNLIIGNATTGALYSDANTDVTTSVGFRLKRDGSAHFGSSVRIRGTLTVGDGTVGVIQSDNWSSLVAGFKLNRDGSAEFSNTLFIGGTATVKGSVIVGSGGAGLIKSQNYSVGVTGWQINQDGSAEFRNITARGDIQASSVTANSITAAGIVAGTITATQIAANTITAGQILAGTITATQIAADTITASQIAANAITANELSANAVTAGKILAGTIVAADIAADTITASQIAANAITANELNAGAVTADKIASSIVLASKYIQLGTGTPTGLPATSIHSGNWVSATSGFLLNGATGAAEFNSLTVRGTADIGGTTTISSNALITGALNVTSGSVQGNWASLSTGWKLFSTGSAEFNGALHVGGTATVKGSLIIGNGSAGAVQSDNWVANSLGFKITRTGTAEFNNTLFVAGATTLCGTVTVGWWGYGQLKSETYSAGVSGWSLLPNGDVEFNSLLARGDVKALSISFPESTAILSPANDAGGFGASVGAWVGLTRSSTVAHTATYSGQFSTPYGESWTTAYLDISNPNPTRNQWYRVEAWVYTAASCQVVFGVAPGASDDRSVDFVPTVATWTKVQVHRMIPAGQNMRVSLAGSTGFTSTYIYIDDITITPISGVVDDLNVQGDIRVLSGATAKSLPRGLIKRALYASTATTSGTTELSILTMKGVRLTAGRDYEVKYHSECLIPSDATGVFLIKLYVDSVAVGQTKIQGTGRFPCDIVIPFSQATDKTNAYVYVTCTRTAGAGTASLYGDHHLWLQDVGETALL